VQGQAAFSTKTLGRKQQRFSLYSSGYRAVWKSRGQAIMLQSNKTDISVTESTRLRKTREVRGMGGEQRQGGGHKFTLHSSEAPFLHAPHALGKAGKTRFQG